MNAVIGHAECISPTPNLSRTRHAMWTSIDHLLGDLNESRSELVCCVRRFDVIRN